MNLIFSLICNIPFLIMAILGIGFLIIFHELGHFLFAKLFGVYVPSFSIGFGPRLIQKKVGETTFAISAIPLGGYVEMAGSPELGQGNQTHAHDTGARAFNNKPYWQKMLIIAGGILFNIIFAYFALSLLFYLGAPCIDKKWCDNNSPAVIYSVTKDSSAAKAGLLSGDKILAVNGQSVTTIAQVKQLLESQIDKDTVLTIERQKIEKTIPVHIDSLEIEGKKEPRLGALWAMSPLSVGQSFTQGAKTTWNIIARTFDAIIGLTKGKEKVGGPLLLITQVTQCAGMGLRMFIFILALISLNLAVFNVLPLPIFDGGQALFYTIEAIIGRPLSDNTREKIHYWTWILVIALVIWLTYSDIFTIFFGKK